MRALLRSRRALVVLGSVITVLMTVIVSGYFAGYRLTAFPADNSFNCSGNADRPAGYTPPPLTEEEQKAYDAAFEKACPGFKSGWLWGDVWITKPNADGRNYDRFYVGSYWRPYWGFILPDYNLGQAALFLTVKH